MNNRYIEYEQFKNLPVEKQEDILKWWQPQKGDLYIDKSCTDYKDLLGILVFEEFQDIEKNELCAYGRDSFSFKCSCIPLLSESQCREYIEYKAGKYTKTYSNLGYNLLQAYWETIKQL